MSLPIEITTLPADAWEAYRDLRLRALKEEPQAFAASYEQNKDLPPDHWQMRLRSAGTSGRDWMYFARQGERLVGMIGAYIDAEDAEGIVRIVAMYITPDVRGQGLAERLMQTILDVLCQQPGLHTAQLQVNQVQKTAVRLYERCGFRVVSEFQFQRPNGILDDDYLMERQLQAPPPSP